MEIIGIDVDGTTGDLMTAWLARYNKDYDDNVKKEDITEWKTEKFVKPECGTKIYRYLEDPSLYSEVKPVPGALEKITALKTSYRVIFITTSTIGASGAKFLWLKKHGFIKEQNDYVECKDKTLIRAKYLIDDNIDNVKAFRQSGGIGILFTEPWNRQYDWQPKAEDWNSLSVSFFSIQTNNLW